MTSPTRAGSTRASTPRPGFAQRGAHEGARVGARKPGRKGGRNNGWLPQQHGAWAMLVVPWLVGLLLAQRAGVLDAARVLLGPAWLLGYLAFNAATLMTKAAPVRRAAYRRPLAVYGASALLLGGTAVVLGGPQVLWWGLAGALLVALALLLTRQKKERSLLAGVVSILAGTGVGVVTRYWAPAEVLSATGTELATLAATVAYFAGTVFTVKTMIRQRGSRGWLAASIGYHVLLLAGVAVAALVGWLGWAWLVLAVLLLARAVWEPTTLDSRPLTVLQIGLIEVAASVLLLVAAVIGTGGSA
ncbi:YwiC-like family protein [Propionibacteriaceae bacterium Y1923]|uniref:YwiC-like family protein n=1 Tax=Aestuariimicrobium sp. Y1814 TaxID=3418742 RepID=UPI003C154F7F